MVVAQLPESSTGKALRLLQERLSTKIANGSNMESDDDRIESNGIVSDAYLLNGVVSNGMGCNGLGHGGVESSGILISSSS